MVIWESPISKYFKKPPNSPSPMMTILPLSIFPFHFHHPIIPYHIFPVQKSIQSSGNSPIFQASSHGISMGFPWVFPWVFPAPLSCWSRCPKASPAAPRAPALAPASGPRAPAVQGSDHQKILRYDRGSMRNTNLYRHSLKSYIIMILILNINISSIFKY